MKLKHTPKTFMDKQTCPVTGFEFTIKRLARCAGHTVLTHCPRCNCSHALRCGKFTYGGVK